jgi:PAS domain S-box-containing protein
LPERIVATVDRSDGRDKTKKQLAEELETMRMRVAELERAVEEQSSVLGNLQEKANRFNDLFEFAPNAYYLNDARGRFVDGNKVAEKLSGYKKEELIGKSFLELNLLSGEQLNKANELLERNVLGEPTGPDEFTLVRKDGRRVDVEISTFPILENDDVLVLGIARDVSDRNKAVEEMKKSEERYGRAAAAGKVGVWEWDLVTDDIFVDSYLKALLGYDDCEIQNRIEDWGRHVHPEDADRVMKAAEACTRGETPLYEVEHRMLHKDGSVRWLLARGIVNRDPEGRPIRMVGSDVDITYRKEAEEKLRSVTALLFKAEEEERRRIARELHDELNQKLALLTVDVESVMLKLTPTEATLRPHLEELKARAGEVSTEAHRLAYRLHPAILDDLGLPAALRSYIAELSRLYKSSFGLTERNVPGRLPRTIATCLYRVGQEALRNAAKHSNSDRVTARLIGTTTGIVLSIRDHGIGFDWELARKQRKGLGLNIMEERVRLVGGTVAIRSIPRGGTLIRFSVPL